jgi:hypothetical protein
MTRAQAALLFATAAIVAIIAGIVTAIVIAGGDGGDSTTHDLSNDLTAAAAASPTLTRHSSLMFCEPFLDSKGSIATWQGEGEVAYAPDSCEPLINPDGSIAVRDEDGAEARGLPTYVDAAQFVLPETIVWMPAKGVLEGQEVVMDGGFIERDASVVVDSFDRPFLILNFTQAGGQVFASLTKRIQGRPLTTFLNGEPLRLENGQIYAPSVEAEIPDTIFMAGLGQDRARRLADLINSGAFDSP